MKDFNISYLCFHKNYFRYLYNIIITYKTTKILINEKRTVIVEPKKIIFVKNLKTVEVLSEDSSAIVMGFNERFTEDFESVFLSHFHQFFTNHDFVITDLLQDPSGVCPLRFKDYSQKNLTMLRQFAVNRIQSLILDGVYHLHQNFGRFS